MKNGFYYNMPIAEIGIVEDNSGITNLYFGGEKIPKDVQIRETELLKKASAQLTEYFNGKRQIFDLPLSIEGTNFQKRVWEALKSISFGETCSYLDIAEKIGNHKATRAVGGANNKNPIPIIIPCHRVIGANGRMVGYSAGLKIKEFLLNLEKRKN